MNFSYYLTSKATFKLKNQINWLKQVKMLKFLNVINCVFLHWRKKLTLANACSGSNCKFSKRFFLSSSFSSDPILTAFQLSDELKKLKQMESQFCAEFSELRKQVQEFSTSLLGAKYLFFSLLVLSKRETNILVLFS